MDKKSLTNLSRTIKFLAISAVLSPTPSSAAVVWDFVAEEVRCFNGAFNGTLNGAPCAAQPTPFPLAELILPGPNSSGTAAWNMFPSRANTPIHSGDDFTLTVKFAEAPVTVHQGGIPNGPILSGYEIAWTEVDNILTDIEITIGGFAEQFTRWRLGGVLYSADSNAPRIRDIEPTICPFFQCVISGEWISTASIVPEPGSLGLLLVAALGMFGIRRLCHGRGSISKA